MVSGAPESPQAASAAATAAAAPPTAACCRWLAGTMAAAGPGGSADKASKVKSLLASYYDLDDGEAEPSPSLYDTPRWVGAAQAVACCTQKGCVVLACHSVLAAPVSLLTQSWGLALPTPHMQHGAVSGRGAALAGVVPGRRVGGRRCGGPQCLVL